MIVDDNDLMRKEIIRSVTIKEDEVFECSSGESAVKKCVEFFPDWILMDIRMPGMNGISAAENIKKLLPDAHIAFITSYDNISYRQKAAMMGIECYFLKSDLLSIRKTLESYNILMRHDNV